MNENALDLKIIAYVLEHKEEIKNNPFANMPKESIEEAFGLIEDRHADFKA